MRWSGANPGTIAAALSLSLSLAACGTPPSSQPAPGPSTTSPAVTVTPLSPRVDVEPEKQVVQPAPRQEAAAPPDPIAEPVNDDPNQLLRLSGKKVAALLGPANYVRRDGSAEIWQYRAVHCVLDVFLFQDNSGLSVAHVDLRKRAGGTITARRCFGGLLAGRH